MKNFSKSILCLVMAFALVLSCAACGNGTSEEIVTEAGPTLEGAEQAVNDFLSDDEALLEVTGLQAAVDELVGTELTEEESDLVELLFSDILDLIDFTVVDSEFASETRADVTFEISYPDFENIDVEAYTSDTDYMFKKLEDLGYTEEDLALITDEDEQTDILMKLVMEILRDASKDAPVVSTQDVASVVYENDEWVVLIN